MQQLAGFLDGRVGDKRTDRKLNCRLRRQHAYSEDFLRRPTAACASDIRAFAMRTTLTGISGPELGRVLCRRAASSPLNRHRLE
jgi:hypothetical protein